MTRGTSKKRPQQKEKSPDSLRPWTAMLTDFFSGATLPAGPGFFFFAAAPRGRSLTHCGPGRRCLCAGVLFLLRPRPDRGGVFFWLWPGPNAHSLTVGWGDFGKARVVFVVLLRPRRTRRANDKKCLVYYIGSRKDPAGPQQK